MPQPQKIVARGVYYLPWLGPNGEIYLAAVNRLGRLVAERVVLPGEDVQLAEEHLQALLDVVDPPFARIVK